jgi:hypothetical protein
LTSIKAWRAQACFGKTKRGTVLAAKSLTERAARTVLRAKDRWLGEADDSQPQ